MTVIITNQRERVRFLRFMAVGVFGAMVDFGTENFLHGWLGVPYVWAGGISFVCAVFSNFTWNRFWTYPDSRSKPVLRQLSEFMLVNVAGLVIRLPILKFVEPLISRWFTGLPVAWQVMPPSVMGENVTLAIAVVIVMFWNFFVNRYWTYSDVK